MLERALVGLMFTWLSAR